MFQFTRKDEDDLWVIAGNLVKNKQFKEAKILIKFISEKAFTSIGLPSDIANMFMTINPSQTPFDENLITRLRQINQEIRDLTKRNENVKAKFAFMDYVETLSKILGGKSRKKIWASLINLPHSEKSLKRPHYLKIQKSDLEVIRTNKIKRVVTIKKNNETNDLRFVQTYAPKEVAEIIGVSAQTVRRMCENGKFPEATKTYGGHWRIPTHYFDVTLEEVRAKKAVKKNYEE